LGGGGGGVSKKKNAGGKGGNENSVTGQTKSAQSGPRKLQKKTTKTKKDQHTPSTG